MSKEYTIAAVALLGAGRSLWASAVRSSSRAAISSHEPNQLGAAPIPATSFVVETVYQDERVTVFEPLETVQGAVDEPRVDDQVALVDDEANTPFVDPFPPREDRDDATLAAAVANVQEQPSTCPLRVSQDAVVVDFGGEDTRPLRADGSRAEAERSVPVALSEGSYTATFALLRESGDGGRLDRVFLKFYDAAGVLIATTSPTRDLEAGEREARERTMAFTLPSAASSITVRHLAYATTEPHFLSVPCVLMEPAQSVPGGSEQSGAPQVSADTGELEAYVVSEMGEGSGRVPEPSLGKGELFSVSEREDTQPEAVPVTRTQMAGVGNADVIRILLPLTMLALTIVGLLALSLVRPRSV